MNKKNRRLRIYAVHLLNDHSGSPRVLADAIEALDSAGFDCRILTSQHSGFLNINSVRKYTVPYARLGNRWLLLLMFVFSQCICFLMLSSLLLRDRLNGNRSIVMVNTLLPFGAFLAARFFARSCIGYIHETSVSPPILKGFLRTVVNCCAQRVIFVSNYLAQAEAFKRPLSCVIYNGLRADLFFKSIDPEFKFHNNIVLFCGSPKFYKGLFQFVSLAAMLENFKFVAALNCSQNELQNLGIKPKKNLTLLAKPNNLSELYESAFLVVNLSIPSLWIETFGLSLLEGMSAGCPVIAPPVGGPTEFVDGTVGACIDSSDIPALIEYIQSLKSNYSDWVAASEEAKIRAASFSAENFRINILNFFNEL